MSTPLRIPSSKSSPNIVFDLEKNEFKLIGRSIPSNASTIYEDVLAWINLNLNKDIKVTVTFELDYFNTSSHKYIFEIIKLIKTKNIENTINQNYCEDDEEMLEIGEKMKIISGFDINFIEVED